MGGFNGLWGLGDCLVLRKSSINVSNNCKVVICEGQVELMKTTKVLLTYILYVKDCKDR